MHSDPEASWEKLSGALKKVDHRVLANKISDYVLPLLQSHKLPVTVPEIGTYNVTMCSSGIDYVYVRPCLPGLYP